MHQSAFQEFMIICLLGSLEHGRKTEVVGWLAAFIVELAVEMFATLLHLYTHLFNL